MRFLFGDYVLDVEWRELRHGGDLVAIEPQVFDLLVYLIRNRDRVVSKDDLLAHVWGGRIVSESTMTSRFTAARHAIGDSGGRQQFIRTVPRRGLRFVGDIREEASTAPGSILGASRAGTAGASPAGTARAPDAQVHQEVTFCRTADGVHLAVATVGDGPPVVKTANWLTHIEYEWQSPVWSPLLAHLAAQFRLIRYDERGNGLSDWEVADISFAAFVRDLETVVDALRLERFALFGISQGAAVSIAYAARHPDRVSRLVLQGGYVQGWRKRGTAEQITQRETLMSLIPGGWGQNNPAFRQVYTSLFMPGGTLEEMQWFNDLQRVSTSPDNAVRLQSAFGEIDVAGLLPHVATPTLVLHSRGDALIPFEQGLMLARAIPNARFVALESQNHLLVAHEPAWRRLVDEMCAFLTEADTNGGKP
jgi:pimeloyl-ACP methyl ester carboxylesterase/DNA-binding winged helix-turn-helix (wHTH) protein